MKYFVRVLCLLPMLAGGCVGPVPVEPAGACGASELQYLVGQPGSVLHGMRFSQPLRVIEFGMPVTMDFIANRLNIELDRNQVINRVSCG